MGNPIRYDGSNRGNEGGDAGWKAKNAANALREPNGSSRRERETHRHGGREGWRKVSICKRIEDGKREAGWRTAGVGRAAAAKDELAMPARDVLGATKRRKLAVQILKPKERGQDLSLEGNFPSNFGLLSCG
ncbi:hypothetical protein Nepgr_030896 [Nepenthes gracilis]|uniref:Uncharacterized protein n=1 Tax=Nepenthes gracilis TaxID=150966 RepID=A0AAD3Y4N8_NEPGR|nr:hypothetical protein Nepgr_030896 [Nepenthes gracilis]